MNNTTNRLNIKDLEHIALLRGINMYEIFLIGINTIDALDKKTKYPIKKTRELIHAGADAVRQKKRTVSFAYAVNAVLEAKAHRRARTLSDIRYITKVFMRDKNGLATRKIRSITTKECSELLEHCFHTQRQRYKARLILHGVFALALKRGWCAENPVSRVDVPVLKETPVMALNVTQCNKLLHAAKHQEKGECLAALGLMLYAGIRPQEIQRLSWKHLNLSENIISIPSIHSKTGGTRHVSIEPALKKILEEVITPENRESLICPINWTKKWQKVRKSAGWDGKTLWVQDCLRHSYASFHALYYKDFTRLQYEMGHSSSMLLRTRYLNMQGLTQDMANRFWAGA